MFHDTNMNPSQSVNTLVEKIKEGRPAFGKYRNLFSLSNSTRKVQDQINQVSRPTFFDGEKQKVNGIRRLIDNGGHEEALRLVLQDFAHEDGISYFNRIRYLENDDTEKLIETPMVG